MSKLAKISLGLILFGSLATVMAAPTGSSVFIITPSVSSVSVSDNGETSVLYTVTNNATSSIPLNADSVDADYQSAGKNLALSENTCTSTLAANGSCTFRVLIPGANQPASFTLTPRMCGFSGFLCSIPSVPVTVTVTTTTLPTRAYEEILLSGLESPATITLLGINIANPSDILSYNLHSSGTATNSVVVSPDGSTVYATENNSLSHLAAPVIPAVVVLHVSNSGFTLLDTIPLSSLGAQAAGVGTNLEMALTPDGSTLFVTQSVAVSEGHLGTDPGKLYRINLNADPLVATQITDATPIAFLPKGVVVSPDGKTVYVGTSGGYILAFPVTATSIDASNEITADGHIEEGLHPGLAIDPAGNTLYIGNQVAGTVTVLNVDGLDASFNRNITTESEPVGLAVSPDGNTLYVGVRGDSELALAIAVNDDDTGEAQLVTGAFGVALTPDGSKLYVGQSEGSEETTTVLNAKVFFATPTTVSTGGTSTTIGKFIGP